MESRIRDRAVEIRERAVDAGALRTAHGTGSYLLPNDQARFWLMHTLTPDAPVCNLAISLRLSGDLDIAKLRGCLDALVNEHAALRCRLTNHGTQVTAHPLPTGLACPWSQTDLSALGATQQTQQLDEALRKAARHRFDLDAPPLLRATLVRLGATSHVLLLVGHHVAVDGTAMFHLIPTELCARYDGKPVQVPTLTSALWSHAERARDQHSNVAADQRYFQRRLHDAPKAINLPIDRAFPSRPTMNGHTVERQLGPQVTTRVADVATSLGVRPFDVLSGAFVAQLMRYSGDRDIVFGTPVANRSSVDGARTLVNCCIDTQIVRVDFAPDAEPTFAEIIAALATDRRAGRAHRNASFSSIVDNLGAPRNPGRNPVYQVMFNYMSFSVSDVEMSSLHIEGARFPVGISMVDLSLDVIETREGVQVALEYNTDVFEEAHAERMLEHFVELLTTSLDAPDTSLGALRLLPAAERDHIEQLSRGPAIEVEDDLLFHEWIWRSARLRPQMASATALHSNRTRRSYASFLRGALALSETLRTRGVGPSVAVAVCGIDDPAATVQAMFAVWFAGGMVVPLDAKAPEARLRAQFTDCGATLYISDASLKHSWAAGFSHVQTPAYLALDATDLGEVPLRAPGLGPSQPAYLMYTSGSSGKPKGVLVSHANMIHQLHARIARYATTPSRMLAPYSFGFDSFIAGLTLTLANGGTLRLLDDDQRRDPRILRDVIRHEGVTHLDVVPSMYGALLSCVRPHDLDSLQVVVCGGEALPASLVAQHWKRVPEARLFNEYGPTEASVFATVHEIPRAVVDDITPIGRPIANTQCWVIDRFGALAPQGHHGELILGGGGIASGYRDPDITQLRFGPIAGLGEWLYRSGDQVRYRADGNLEFLGRVDEQVQVRGYRVEPAEVEAALKQHPEVIDAAVILRDDAPDSPQLVAYVTTNGATPAVDPTEILRGLRSILPTYMVPNVVVPLGSLPRTSNGKLDRALLPAPQVAPRTQETRAPRNATEAAVVAAWRNVLRLDDVGIDDDFFDLGGTSLLAIRLVSLIQEHLGQHVSVTTLFREPTPAGLARALQSSDATASTRCIEELCAQGDGVPVVFVGSLNQTRLLARRLPPTRRMYGLNMFGLHDEREAPSMAVNWTVDQFLREVREVLPHGPYVLAAYCEDGKIAYEMTQRLRGMGERVPLLALIDAVWWFDRPAESRSRLGGLWRQVRELGLGFALRKTRRRIQSLATEGARLLDAKLRRRQDAAQQVQEAHETMVTRYLDALAAHDPRPRDHRGVIHYVAQEWFLEVAAFPAIPLRSVSGLHDQMFEGPQLDELARHIESDLANADEAIRAR